MKKEIFYVNQEFTNNFTADINKNPIGKISLTMNKAEIEDDIYLTKHIYLGKKYNYRFKTIFSNKTQGEIYDLYRVNPTIKWSLDEYNKNISIFEYGNNLTLLILCPENSSSEKAKELYVIHTLPKELIKEYLEEVK